MTTVYRSPAAIKAANEYINSYLKAEGVDSRSQSQSTSVRGSRSSSRQGAYPQEQPLFDDEAKTQPAYDPSGDATFRALHYRRPAKKIMPEYRKQAETIVPGENPVRTKGGLRVYAGKREFTSDFLGVQYAAPPPALNHPMPAEPPAPPSPKHTGIAVAAFAPKRQFHPDIIGSEELMVPTGDLQPRPVAKGAILDNKAFGIKVKPQTKAYVHDFFYGTPEKAPGPAPFPERQPPAVLQAPPSYPVPPKTAGVPPAGSYRSQQHW